MRGIRNQLRAFIALFSVIIGSAASFALAPNQVQLRIDTPFETNGPTLTLTVCQPGTHTCQTINDVLLDTGSAGLRLFRTPNFKLKLPLVTQNEIPVYETVTFGGCEFNGGLHRADLQIAGEIAKNLIVQVGDAPSPADSSGLSHFNGILGIGPMSDQISIYTACKTQETCTPVSYTARIGLVNPVPHFANDNNGYSIEFPDVSAPLAKIEGVLTFGINTNPDNQLSPKVERLDYTTAERGDRMIYELHGLFNGKVYPVLIDSGASTMDLPVDLTVKPSLFHRCGDDALDELVNCPAHIQSLPLTLKGENSSLNLNILSYWKKGEELNHPVVPYLTSLNTDNDFLVLGLPFFFGRRVVFGLANTATNPKTKNYLAFN